MGVPNIALQRARDIMAGGAAGPLTGPIDSIGIGTDGTAFDPGDTQLGANGKNAYYKTPSIDGNDQETGGVEITHGGDGTDDPWVKFTVRFLKLEANDADPFREMGLAAGTLSGQNPSGHDNGEKLFTRRIIGSTNGVGKDDQIQLIGEVKVIY